MNERYLIVIAGPTAVGKTELTIQLAQHFKTVVLSADSRQFFKEMNIGTAKPTSSDLNAVPHYFINSHSIKEPYSAGKYEEDVLKLLTELYKNHRSVILTGGSGLYIRAVSEGMDELPEVPSAIRNELIKIHEDEGIIQLQSMLFEKDPVYYKEVDLQNPQRLIRALEVCLTTGKPYSSFRKKTAVPRPFSNIKIGLEREREELYERINRRVDKMFEAGLFNEARKLWPNRGINALETVGYQELFDYFEGKHDLAEAKRLIKRNTRRYAKRQMTWFRKDTETTWFHPEEKKEIFKFIKEKIKDS